MAFIAIAGIQLVAAGVFWLTMKRLEALPSQ
jgi:hypothetical protein